MPTQKYCRSPIVITPDIPKSIPNSGLFFFLCLSTIWTPLQRVNRHTLTLHSCWIDYLTFRILISVFSDHFSLAIKLQFTMIYATVLLLSTFLKSSSSFSWLKKPLCNSWLLATIYILMLLVSCLSLSFPAVALTKTADVSISTQNTVDVLCRRLTSVDTIQNLLHRNWAQLQWPFFTTHNLKRWDEKYRQIWPRRQNARRLSIQLRRTDYLIVMLFIIIMHIPRFARSMGTAK